MKIKVIPQFTSFLSNLELCTLQMIAPILASSTFLSSRRSWFIHITIRIKNLCKIFLNNDNTLPHKFHGDVLLCFECICRCSKMPPFHDDFGGVWTEIQCHIGETCSQRLISICWYVPSTDCQRTQDLESELFWIVISFAHPRINDIYHRKLMSSMLS